MGQFLDLAGLKKVIDGIDIRISTAANLVAGKSAYELYCEHFGYTKSERQWLIDLATGKLQLYLNMLRYFLIENGTAIDGIALADGTALTADGALNFDNAVGTYEKSLVIPLDQEFEIAIKGTIDYTAPLLVANTNDPDDPAKMGAALLFVPDGTIRMSVFAENEVLCWTWEIDPTLLSKNSEYIIRYCDGRLTLSVDGNPNQDFAYVSYATTPDKFMVDSANAVAMSQNLLRKWRAISGNNTIEFKFLGLNNIGVTASVSELSAVTLPMETSQSPHPVEGKKFYFLGSSNTHGSNSFPEKLAKFFGAVTSKHAVSGTTIAERVGRSDSYVERLADNLPGIQAFNPDFFGIQLSTNDFGGSVAPGKVAGKDIAVLDKTTMTGALESMIRTIQTALPNTNLFIYSTPMQRDWNQKVNYASYIAAQVAQLRKEYNIGYVDIFNDETIDLDPLFTNSSHPSEKGHAFLVAPAIADYAIDHVKDYEETPAPEMFKLTIDTRQTSTSALGTETHFILPTGNAFDYDWSIDWGDGVVESKSGSGAADTGIEHSYSVAGQYIITITPNSSLDSWLKAYGYSASASSSTLLKQAERNKVVTCHGLLTPAMVALQGEIGIGQVGNSALRGWFQDCKGYHFTMGNDFGLSPEWSEIRTVGTYFMSNMFHGCSGQAFTMGAKFNFPPNLKTLGQNSIRDTFNGCNGAQFTMNDICNLPQQVETVANNVFYYVFAGCFGDAFQVNDVFQFPLLGANELNRSGVFLYAFSVSQNKSYVRQARTIASIINGNSTPTSTKRTFATFDATQGANRWSDWDSVDADWK